MAADLNEIERQRVRAAVERRADRYIRFSETQLVRRRWVRLSDLAAHYGRYQSSSNDDLTQLQLLAGFAALLRSINQGYFESGGRSQLLHLHPVVQPSRLSADNIAAVVSMGPDVWATHYVGCCWAPAAIVAQWCDDLDLPSFFEPAKKRGRPRLIDEVDFVSLMRDLLARGEVDSERAAAKRVVYEHEARISGNSLDAKVARVRESYRKAQGKNR